jgi:hypothetical protein
MSSELRGTNEPDWGFDWPPKQKIVPSEVVELKKSAESKAQAISPQQTLDNPLLELVTRPLPLPLPVHPPQPQTTSDVPAAQPQDAQATNPAIVREELPAEVQEELKGLDADFWAPIALEGYLKRGWVMPAAIVALTLIAIVEGIFLLRGRSQQTYVASQPYAASPGAAPKAAQQTTLPPTPAPPIVPSPAAANPNPIVPPSTASRPPAPTDVASERRDAIQPRTTPAAEAARPAPKVVPPATPAQEPGWVTIATPIELNVSEKGSVLGSTRGPRILLSAGGHVLQLENTTFGYRENQWVRIHAGKETTLALSLPQGVVHVNATPWADISIDGQSFGQTPIGNLKLTIGSHDVVFRHPDLGEKTVSAIVKVGVPTRVSADLTQK